MDFSKINLSRQYRYIKKLNWKLQIIITRVKIIWNFNPKINSNNFVERIINSWLIKWNSLKKLGKGTIISKIVRITRINSKWKSIKRRTRIKIT